MYTVYIFAVPTLFTNIHTFHKTNIQSTLIVQNKHEEYTHCTLYTYVNVHTKIHITCALYPYTASVQVVHYLHTQYSVTHIVHYTQNT